MYNESDNIDTVLESSSKYGTFRETALMKACRTVNLKMVKHLIKLGADVNFHTRVLVLH